MVISIGFEGHNNAGKTALIDEMIAQFETRDKSPIIDALTDALNGDAKKTCVSKIVMTKIHPVYDNANAKLLFDLYGKWNDKVDPLIKGNDNKLWGKVLNAIAWATAMSAAHMAASIPLLALEDDDDTLTIVLFDRTIISTAVYNILIPLEEVLKEPCGIAAEILTTVETSINVILSSTDLFSRLSLVYYIYCDSVNDERAEREKAAYQELKKYIDMERFEERHNNQSDIEHLKALASEINEEIVEMIMPKPVEENSWAKL